MKPLLLVVMNDDWPNDGFAPKDKEDAAGDALGEPKTGAEPKVFP